MHFYDGNHLRICMKFTLVGEPCLFYTPRKRGQNALSRLARNFD